MKSKCKDIKGQITLYLDDELQGRERIEFERHLQDCDSCRALLESDRRFLEAVRQYQPLRPAPAELRARVENLLTSSQAAPVSPSHLQKIKRFGAFFNNASPKWSILRITAAAAAVIALFLVVGVYRNVRERKHTLDAGPSDFALMAADTHLRHLRGQLPLEIVSTEPEHISGWFQNKLPFKVALPHYQESSGQEKLYELEGARLVGYKSDYAAYVSYQMHQRPISLVITSELVAKPAGGHQIQAKGLTFHYDSVNGLKVLTWSDRGLTYALVSDLEERGQQSCIVCHQGTKDQDVIDSLKPRS